jgi:hypothetical protein
MKGLFLILTLTGISRLSYAQDDLLKMISQEAPAAKEAVKSTFKTSKIINVHTTEMLARRNLDFRVGHRFGNMGGRNGGIHTLYGFDNSNDIRIAFEYGITGNLMAGISRSKRNENFEGFIKYRLSEQKTDNSMPVSLALFANTAVSGQSLSEYSKFSRRVTYFYELIKFSMLIAPGLLHRNYISDPGEKNDIPVMGIGARLKITRSSALVADYHHIFSKYLLGSGNPVRRYLPLGIGYEIETGGHVFTLMLTNASGFIENDFLANTTDSWGDGGFKFSFNISRVFKL